MIILIGFNLLFIVIVFLFLVIDNNHNTYNNMCSDTIETKKYNIKEYKKDSSDKLSDESSDESSDDESFIMTNNKSPMVEYVKQDSCKSQESPVCNCSDCIKDIVCYCDDCLNKSKICYCNDCQNQTNIEKYYKKNTETEVSTVSSDNINLENIINTNYYDKYLT